MRSKNIISVIIPTYNRAHTLLNSVNSVINQTYQNIELIIVDDGSIDNTEEVVKKIKDKRVKYVKLSKNVGACVARNIGIDLSKGEYIAFNDSDDIWHKDKLEKQIKALLKNKVDMVYCAIHRHYSSNYDSEKIPSEELIKKIRIQGLKNVLWEKNSISTGTILCSANVAREIRFDANLPRYQDWDFAIRACQKFKLFYQDEILIDAYEQTDSISISVEKEMKALLIIYEKNKKEIERNPNLKIIWSKKKTDAKFWANAPVKKDCLKTYRISKDKKYLIKYFLALTGIRKIIIRQKRH